MSHIVQTERGPLDRVLKKYATSQESMDQIRYTAESLSLQFDRWDKQYVRGLSLSVLIVAELNFGEYTGWRGTKHMSALEKSLREDGIWAVTLSEEDGRSLRFWTARIRIIPATKSADGGGLAGRQLSSGVGPRPVET